jgi:hypothetical protein
MLYTHYSARALFLVGKAKGSKHAYIIATVVTIQDLACDHSMRLIWKPNRQQKVALTGLSQRLRASEPLYFTTRNRDPAGVPPNFLLGFARITRRV